MTNKLLLAYCKENEISAHEIERELKPVGFAFEHLVCQSSEDYMVFNQRIQEQALPVLLLVSDNYLKSLAAMYQALPAIQNMISAARLQPIVVDGYHLRGEEGVFERVPTQFDRIGQIIKYMNYWQEEYLNLRQRNKDTQGEEKAMIEKELKITRSVSTQIGEFLRYLRETDYWEYQLLKENHFEPIFKVFGNEVAYQEYVAQYAAKSELSHASSIPSPAGVELEPVPQLVVIEEEVEEEPPMAAPELDSPETPGVDLLDSSPVPQESSIQLTPELVSSSEITVPIVEPEASVVEDNAGLSFQENLEEMIEEVAEEEALLEENSEEGSLTDDKQKSYDILQSIFDDDDDEEPEETPIKGHQNEDIEEDNQPDIEHIPTEENIDQGALEQLRILAQDAESHNDLLLAKSYYEKINSLYPGIEDVNYKLGILTISCFNNQDKQATKYLKKAIKINPENNQARYQLGIILAERLDKPQKAIKQFMQTLEQQPDHPFANYDLALLYHRLGNLEAATEYYEQAFHLNPELKTEENDLAFNFKETEEVANEKKALHESLYPELHLMEEVKMDDEVIEVVEEVPEPVKMEAPDQKTVLITGATSGIGLATAHIFAQNGYRLVLTGRRAERLEALQEKLQSEFQTTSLPLSFDVRDRAATQTALEQLAGEWGQIDILINNAGLAKGFAPIHEGNIDDWETMIDTNVKGLLYMTRAIAPKMVQNRKGHIINIASTAGKEVYPNGNVYCASKFAVDALTQSMRLDLHKYQIRVSQVAPGHVEETEFAIVRFDGDSNRAKIYEDFNPLTSKDVAETIYFIATRPPHVNIQDVLMMGTQQASSNHIDRSGRD